MREALKQAALAYQKDEVPVGAVIVHQGKVIARASNQRELLKDPTAHAEMIAMTQAAAALEDWRLSQTTLYVTLEPCLMCFGAILQARIPCLVTGTANPREGVWTRHHGAFDGADEIVRVEGILEEECRSWLQEFFRNQRIKNKKPGNAGHT